ncbi:methyltransferase type 11 [Saccharothrix sp. NRRL B-16348]|uniref:class I SAM-dependent methyltransferase n=1 Tax=Saccharothrix sp. NRRL B-16348 TaxID=1415542 RepID=UPI0003C98CB6|nr:class I SAM-dependent methyltransferase [Saccharothrix sp. NRRL B-16348]AGZ94320.1 putative methyltransferase [Saccharothrix sp. NRRL B-16348]KOX18626.1 methyltransferase type 11 [Saccharothrix sp. NRRL B-16348]
MPTLPSEPHRARALAESFGTDPERYDRARPSYPDAMVRAIVAASPGPDVVDVGTGTGIAARLFQAAGCRVLGVEVDPRMAAWARRRGLDVEVAGFEDWDPAGRVFDAVVSGQTWHWVDPVAGAAKAARVLRPGGRLAVFWNVAQPPPDLAEALADVYRRVLPDSLAAFSSTTTGHSPFTTKAVDGIRQSGAFGDPEEWRFDWERTYTRDEWLDQLPTAGTTALLTPTQLDEVLAATAAAVDAVGGSFTMRYTALVVTATRSGAD